MPKKLSKPLCRKAKETMTDKKHKAPELAFTPVKSSQIKDIHYDATGKTLHVRFHSAADCRATPAARSWS